MLGNPGTEVRELPPGRFNAVDALIDRHLTEGRSNKAAILTIDRVVTYAQLVESVNRFGNALLARGIKPNDRLLMVVKDCPEFYFLFWGCVKAGIIPVPANTMLGETDYAFILADTGAVAVAFSDDFVEKVPLTDGVALISIESCLVDEAAAASAVLETSHAAADSLCFLLYSSGTSGAPKGVTHTHRHIIATCRLFAAATIGCEEKDIFFSISRLFFAYGFGFGMNFPLWVGGTAVLDPRRPTPETAIEMIGRFRVTIFAAVPSFYASIVAQANVDTDALSSLRRCISGGEALPAELQRRWAILAPTPILDGVGSTETLNTFISNRPAAIRDGSSGQLVYGYQAKILNSTGEQASDGQIGRLWVSGPSVTSEYWNNAAKTAASIVDDWFDTGDTYHRDDDGYYFYRGRSDDMLKVGGMWVSPFEVEGTLVAHPDVLEAAVVGRSDESGLIKPEAWIVLRDPESESQSLIDDIRDFCKRSMAPYKYPRWIRCVESLPRTATGKVKRHVLRAAALHPG